jgi:hypothetical protein
MVLYFFGVVSLIQDECQNFAFTISNYHYCWSIEEIFITFVAGDIQPRPWSILIFPLKPVPSKSKGPR